MRQDLQMMYVSDVCCIAFLILTWHIVSSFYRVITSGNVGYTGVRNGCFTLVNTLRPRQHGRYFPDDIFKCIFLNENVGIPIKISMKFVPKGSINIIPALVQIMAWRRPGDKPLSEPMVVSLPTHICVTRTQWVKMSICIVFKHTLEMNIHQCFTFDTPVSMKWRDVVFYDVSDVPSNVTLPTYCHMMTSWQTLSALLDLCAWNPPITDGFPPQRTSNVELLRFICL